MGLCLNYRLILPGEIDVDTVRETLAALKDFASNAGFDAVLGPSQHTADDLREGDQRDIVRIVAWGICGDAPDFYGVPSEGIAALAFVVVPGDECEPAPFGFIAPGLRRAPLSSHDDLHPADWFWSACCKTQYASMVSDEHLIRCHVGLVRVLDHAATLGITVEVDDETGYWKHRSTETLFDQADGTDPGVP